MWEDSLLLVLNSFFFSSSNIWAMGSSYRTGTWLPPVPADQRRRNLPRFTEVTSPSVSTRPSGSNEKAIFVKLGGHLFFFFSFFTSRYLSADLQRERERERERCNGRTFVQALSSPRQHHKRRDGEYKRRSHSLILGG